MKSFTLLSILLFTVGLTDLTELFFNSLRACVSVKPLVLAIGFLKDLFNLMGISGFWVNNKVLQMVIDIISYISTTTTRRYRKERGKERKDREGRCKQLPIL